MTRATTTFSDPNKLTKKNSWWSDAEINSCIEEALLALSGGVGEKNTYLLKQTFQDILENKTYQVAITPAVDMQNQSTPMGTFFNKALALSPDCNFLKKLIEDKKSLVSNCLETCRKKLENLNCELLIDNIFVSTRLDWLKIGIQLGDVKLKKLLQWLFKQRYFDCSSIESKVHMETTDLVDEDQEFIAILKQIYKFYRDNFIKILRQARKQFESVVELDIVATLENFFGDAILSDQGFDGAISILLDSLERQQNCEDILRRVNTIYSTQTDVFDEILPAITNETVAFIKILFPLNQNQQHWLLGEIQLHKVIINDTQEYQFKIFAHDPYGGGKLDDKNFIHIKSAIESRLQGAKLYFENHESPFLKPRQSDASSCGPITIESLIKRVKGESLDILEPYPAGAEELRKKLFVTIKRRELFNQGKLQDVTEKALFELEAKKYLEEESVHQSYEISDENILTYEEVAKVSELAVLINTVNLKFENKCILLQQQLIDAKEKLDNANNKNLIFEFNSYFKEEQQRLADKLNEITNTIKLAEDKNTDLGKQVHLIEELAGNTSQRKAKYFDKSEFLEENLDEIFVQFTRGVHKAAFETDAQYKSKLQKQVYQYATIESQIKNQQELLKKLTDALDRKNIEIQTKLNNSNKIQSELIRLKKKMDDYEKKIKDLSGIKDALQNVKKNYEKSLEYQDKTIKQDKKNYLNERDNLDKKIINFEKDLFALQQSLSSREIELTQFNNEYLQLQQQLARLETSRQKLGQYYLQMALPVVPGFLNAYVPYNGQIESTANSIATTNTQIKQIQQNIQNKSDAVAIKSAEIVSIKSQIDSTQKSLDSIKAKMATHTRAWEVQEKQHKIDIQQLRQNLEEIHIQLTDGETALNNKKSKLKKCVATITTKQIELQHVQSIITEVNKVKKFYEDSLLACKTKIAQLSQQPRVLSSISKVFSVQDLVAKTEEDGEVPSFTLENDDAIISQLQQAKTKKTLHDLQLKNLKNELSEIQEQIIILKSENMAAEMKQSAKQKLINEQLDCLQAYQVLERKYANVKNEWDEQLQLHLLGMGIVATGFAKQEKLSIIDQLIICLLQPIFNNYSLYELGSAANAIFSKKWQVHINNIKKKLKFVETSYSYPLTEIHIANVIDAINEEYINDRVALDVTILDKKLILNSNYLAADKNKQIISVALWPVKQNYLLLMPDNNAVNPDPLVHAHRLINILRFKNELMGGLCKYLLERSEKKVLVDITEEQLADYFHKHQKEINQCNNYTELMKCFFVYELATIDSNLFKTTFYILNKIHDLLCVMPKEKQEQMFITLRDYYLERLKLLVTEELKRRADVEAQMQIDVDARQAGFVNHMQSLEKQMQSLDEYYNKEEKVLAEKKINLQSRMLQADEAKESYLQQANTIAEKIQQLEGLQIKIKHNLEILKKDIEKNREQIVQQEAEKYSLNSEKTVLENKKKEVLAELDKQVNHKLQLAIEQNNINGEKNKLVEKRQQAQNHQQKVDARLIRLEHWRKFLKTLHEILLANKELFVDRKNILYQLHNKTQLIQIYDYLVTHPHLTSLASVAVRESLIVLDDPLWSEQFKLVINDVLGEPKITLDGVNNKFLVRANNISWRELELDLESDIVKRITPYGLDFNGKKLIVNNAMLLGRITDLPRVLKNLIDSHIKQKCLHYTQNQQQDNPLWHEMQAEYDEVKNVIDSLTIDLNDVLKAYASTIELVVGHNLYLDKDIRLPGINLTFYCKEKIYCKADLKIDTSGNVPMQLPERAHNGDYYRVAGKSNGHPGDDGLNGAAGNNAGHIFIRAEGTIENLASIHCIANGANGVDGQKAGYGDEGSKGTGTADAKATPMDTGFLGLGGTCTHFAQAKIPGLDAHGNIIETQLSGPGGNAGLAGLGGEGGLPGEIIIEDRFNQIKRLQTEEKILLGPIGEHYQPDLLNYVQSDIGAYAVSDAKGGLGGEPGPIGCDQLLINKGPGLFKSKIDVDQKGEFDESRFHAIAESVKSYPLFHSVIDGFSDNYRQQFRLNYIFKPDPQQKQNESQYRLNPRRDEQSRGQKGQDNANRTKSNATRLKALPSQNAMNQVSYLAQLHQIATALNHDHQWQEIDQCYARKAAELKTEIEQYDATIEMYKHRGTEQGNQLADIAQQLQQVQANIAQVEHQQQHINLLLQKHDGAIVENDIVQLSNLNCIAEIEAKRLAIHADIACTRIDATNQQSLAKCFTHFYKRLHETIVLSIKSRQKDFLATEQQQLARQTELAKLKQEYLAAMQAYEELDCSDQHKYHEQHLRKLEQSLLHNTKSEQTFQESLHAEILLNHSELVLLDTDKYVENAAKPLVRELILINNHNPVEELVGTKNYSNSTSYECDNQKIIFANTNVHIDVRSEDLTFASYEHDLGESKFEEAKLQEIYTFLYSAQSNISPNDLTNAYKISFLLSKCDEKYTDLICETVFDNTNVSTEKKRLQALLRQSNINSDNNHEFFKLVLVYAKSFQGSNRPQAVYKLLEAILLFDLFETKKVCLEIMQSVVECLLQLQVETTDLTLKSKKLNQTIGYLDDKISEIKDSQLQKFVLQQYLNIMHFQLEKDIEDLKSKPALLCKVLNDLQEKIYNIIKANKTAYFDTQANDDLLKSFSKKLFANVLNQANINPSELPLLVKQDVNLVDSLFLSLIKQCDYIDIATTCSALSDNKLAEFSHTIYSLIAEEFARIREIILNHDKQENNDVLIKKILIDLNDLSRLWLSPSCAIKIPDRLKALKKVVDLVNPIRAHVLTLKQSSQAQQKALGYFDIAQQLNQFKNQQLQQQIQTTLILANQQWVEINDKNIWQLVLASLTIVVDSEKEITSFNLFNQCLFSLIEVLRQDPVQLEAQVESIERNIATVKYAFTNNAEKFTCNQQNSFSFFELLTKIGELEKILEYQLIQQLVKLFNQYKLERKNNDTVLNDIFEKIVLKYNLCLSYKDTQNRNNHKNFIKLVLKKLQSYLLIANENFKKPFNYHKNFFEKLLEQIEEVNHSKENSVEVVEQILLESLNQQALGYASEMSWQYELVNCPNKLKDAVLDLTRMLKTKASNVDDIGCYWYEIANKFFCEINDSGLDIFNQDWVKEIVKMSCAVLNTFIFNTSKQQRRLDELHGELLLLIRNFTPDELSGKYAFIKQMIIALKHATFKISNYIYINDAAAAFEKYRPYTTIETAWESVEKTSVKMIEKLFSDIDIDNVNTLTRTELARNCCLLFQDSILYSPDKLGHKIQKLFNQANQKLQGIDGCWLMFQEYLELSANENTYREAETFLRKLYLKIKGMPVENLLAKETDLFIDQLTIYLQADCAKLTSISKSALDEIILYLLNIYQSELLEEKYNLSDLKAFLSHLNAVGFAEERSELVLLVSVELYRRLIRVPSTSINSSVLQTCLNDCSLALLNTNQNDITNLLLKEIHNPVPKNIISFIAIMPLVSSSVFTSENCKQVLQAIADLIDNDGIKNIVSIAKLISAMLHHHATAELLAKYALQESEVEHSVIIARYLVYVDHLLERLISTKTQDERNKLFEEIKLIANEILNYNNIKLFNFEKLLTPVEAQISAHLSAEAVELILRQQQPSQWEKQLKDHYFVLIKTANVNIDIKVLSDAYYSAVNKNQLSIFLACVDLIIRKNQVEHHATAINDILLSIDSINDLNRLQTVLEKHSLVEIANEYLLVRTMVVMQKMFDDNEQISWFLSKFEAEKYEIFKQDENGRKYLKMLTNAFINYEKSHKKYKFKFFEMENLLQLLNEVQPFKNYHILDELNKKSILVWKSYLKREKIIQALPGIDRADTQYMKLVSDLARLDRDQSSDLVWKFLEQIEFLSHSCQLPLSTLQFIVTKFCTKQWQFDAKSLEIVKEKPFDQWINLLIEHHAKSSSEQSPDCSLEELLKYMRDDVLSINASIKHLLQVDPVANQNILEKRLASINVKFDAYKNHSEAEIKQWAENFKNNGEANFRNEHKIIEFSAVMMRAIELSKRRGFSPRTTQLIALLIFIDAFDTDKGCLANISTGEGKSLITIMLAIARVLRGEKVDILTSSKVLAERDAKASEKLFSIFNINVSNNCDTTAEKSEIERKNRYLKCEVIYGEVGSFQRDLLLTKFFNRDIRQRQGNSLIVDEVDSMFIDNAERTLYLSHSISDLKHLRDLFLFIWATVNAPDKRLPTKQNIATVKQFVKQQVKEKNLLIPISLQKFVKHRLMIWIRSAYRAKSMDVGELYCIGQSGEKYGKAIVMDLDTGVEQMTTQWSNGLHQFIQLKNYEKLTEETLKAVFMANLSFFQLYRGHINGMTGTLGSDIEVKLMEKLYDLKFFKLPCYRKERYVQEEAVVSGDENVWIQAIIKDVDEKMYPTRIITLQEKTQAESRKKTLNIALETEKSNYQQQKENSKEVYKHIENIKFQIEKISVSLKQTVLVSLVKGKQSAPNTNTALELRNSPREKWLAEKDILEKSLHCEKLNVQILEDQLTETKIKILDIESEIKYLEQILKDKISRAVLIICKNQKMVAAIENVLKQYYGKSKNIKKYDSALSNFQVSQLGPDDIVVATNIAGRGTDFETSRMLEENGGLHVILSYVPDNIRIETQAFRRTARQGNKGTGKFIVWHPDAKNESISIDLLCDIRDEKESQRLDKILKEGVPKILLEQKLFERFAVFQQQVKSKLETSSNSYFSSQLEFVRLQLNSLQNSWAFFLDEMSKKINNAHQDDDTEIWFAYEAFEKKMLILLEQGQFKLITESSELMKLAKLFYKAEHYRVAEDCYDTVIERDPEFAAFAYYYKAGCIIGKGTGNYGAKVRARAALKRAIELFENMLSRLSTANQVIHFIGEQHRALGFGQQPDQFTASNINEMSLILVHLQAAKDAYGIELTEESFKSGTITGDENKTIFANLREHLSGSVFKDTRVSKKASAISEFPKEFEFCKAKVMDILNPGQTLHPDIFNKWMLDKEKFLVPLQDFNYAINSKMIDKHEDFTLNIKGTFGDEELDQHALVIKGYLSSFNGVAIGEDEFKQNIAELTGLPPDNVIRCLEAKNIIKVSEKIALADDIKDKIQIFLSTIKLNRSNPNETFDNLGLDKFPKLFKTKEKNIKAQLRQYFLDTNPIPLTAETLGLEYDQFEALRSMLRKQNILEQPLLKILSLEDKFEPMHHREVEDTLIAMHQYGEVRLPDLASERSHILWSKLKDLKIVKNPTVKFKLEHEPERRLDEIKKVIKNNIDRLIKDKSDDDKEKYVDSIFEALEKAAGRIKRFEEVKLDEQSLQDYFREGKMPPEIKDFIYECCDDVLLLEKDHGWFSLDAFICALIGVVQIAAGVIITGLSFGAASFIGNALISEGIGDIVYAVQNSINGTFSWKTYGDYKWQSLLLSVATAGVGASIAKAAQSAKVSVDVAKNLGKEILKQCSQAVISSAITITADKLAQEATKSIFQEVKSGFKTWVESDASYQREKNNLKQILAKIYKKFGAQQAAMIVNQVMLETTKSISGDIASQVGNKLMQAMQSLSIQLGMTADQMKQSSNQTIALVGNITDIVTKVIKTGNYINKLREIATLTPRFVSTFVTALMKASEKASNNTAQDYDQNDIDAFCEEQLKKQTDAILQQVEVFINQNLIKGSVQTLLQFSVQPFQNVLFNQLSTDLQQLEKEGDLNQKHEQETEYVNLLACTETVEEIDEAEVNEASANNEAGKPDEKVVKPIHLQWKERINHSSAASLVEQTPDLVPQSFKANDKNEDEKPVKKVVKPIHQQRKERKNHSSAASLVEQTPDLVPQTFTTFVFEQEYNASREKCEVASCQYPVESGKVIELDKERVNEWKIGTRLIGGAQCVIGTIGGVTSFCAAAGTSVTGIGALGFGALGLMSFDSGYTGCKTLLTGQYQPTAFNYGLLQQGLGFSEQKADDVELVTNLAVAAVPSIAKGSAMLIGKFGGLFKGSTPLAAVQNSTNLPQFATKELLESHFNKHGMEFKNAFANPKEYLIGAHDVIKNGIKVSYDYKGEIRIGYIRFAGNTNGKIILNNIRQPGIAKFEFVGTNNIGNITTYHIESGKSFWTTLNEKPYEKIITPYQQLDFVLYLKNSHKP